MWHSRHSTKILNIQWQQTGTRQINHNFSAISMTFNSTIQCIIVSSFHILRILRPKQKNMGKIYSYHIDSFRLDTKSSEWFTLLIIHTFLRYNGKLTNGFSRTISRWCPPARSCARCGRRCWLINILTWSAFEFRSHFTQWPRAHQTNVCMNATDRLVGWEIKPSNHLIESNINQLIQVVWWSGQVSVSQLAIEWW